MHTDEGKNINSLLASSGSQFDYQGLGSLVQIFEFLFRTGNGIWDCQKTKTRIGKGNHPLARN
jgi:hypothetical protein